jgi:hypothetical protein
MKRLELYLPVEDEDWALAAAVKIATPQRKERLNISGIRGMEDITGTSKIE